MTPEEKLERMRKTFEESAAREDHKIVQFEVADYYIYALLADGTLWRQDSENLKWEQIKGPF